MASRLLPPGSVVHPVDWTNPAVAKKPAEEKCETSVERGLPRDEPIDLEALQKAAYDLGFRDGEEKATREAAARVDATVARLARTVDDLAATRARVLAQADRDIVQLSMAIARRILRRELAVDPDSLAGIVRAAIERVSAREINRVRVHPDDAGCLEQHLKTPGMAGLVEICRDPSLERGGIVFETVHGNLDGSIPTQLEEIERGLTDMLRRRTA
jgi:flagellar assembly protein FliH